MRLFALPRQLEGWWIEPFEESQPSGPFSCNLLEIFINSGIEFVLWLHTGVWYYIDIWEQPHD